MTETETPTTPVDKSSWGEGPWQQEPDKKLWVDPATGYQCAIIRVEGMGHLCGYVRIGAEHPAYRADPDVRTYDDDGNERQLSALEQALNNLSVHGGITYDRDYLPTEDAAGAFWWFGFDCAHSGDLMPKHQVEMIRLRGRRSWDDEEIYRDLPYVEDQVTSLAQQLKAMEDMSL